MDRLIELAAPILRDQHALITRPQAIRLTGSDAALRRLLARRIWEPLERGLYGPTGTPMSWHRRLMAASLLAPARSLVSHRASATLQQVGGLVEPMPEISIPAGTTFRREWLITHESTDLRLAEPVVIDGIPTTGPCRLAMDLGCVVSVDRYRHTIRELRHGHGVSSEDLLRTYLRHKRQGRNGGAFLRDWLDRYFTISGSAESGLEQVVLDAVIDACLPPPVLQFWVQTAAGRYRLDLAWPSRLLAVEVDGSQHRDPDIAADDERRTEALRALGWHVIRIRSDHLATDTVAALREIRRCLSLP